MAFYRWREPPADIGEDVGFRVVIECPADRRGIAVTRSASPWPLRFRRSDPRTRAEGLDHETTAWSD